MIDLLRNNGNKLRASAAASVLSLVALNSCAMPKDTQNELIAPECAVHVDKNTDEAYIQRVAELSEIDEATLTDQIEKLNGGIDVSHLSRGDDIALGAEACNALLDNRDAVYELDIRLLPNNASTTK